MLLYLLCDGAVTVPPGLMRRYSMKLTYPICCGVDVHKTFLVATVITSSYEAPKYKQKRFSIHYNQLLLFRQ